MVTVNEALETGSVIWSSNIKTMAKTYVWCSVLSMKLETLYEILMLYLTVVKQNKSAVQYTVYAATATVTTTTTTATTTYHYC
jgi:hypothetical protein